MKDIKRCGLSQLWQSSTRFPRSPGKDHFSGRKLISSSKIPYWRSLCTYFSSFLQSEDIVRTLVIKLASLSTKRFHWSNHFEIKEEHFSCRDEDAAEKMRGDTCRADTSLKEWTWVSLWHYQWFTFPFFAWVACNLFYYHASSERKHVAKVDSCWWNGRTW